MLTVLPVPGLAWPAAPGPGIVLPGRPWAVRLAGAQSACPALELYEAGELLDVVSSTRLAARLARGARAADGAPGPCALAWGRLPLTGASLEVEFSAGGSGLGRTSHPAAATAVTSWCWLAAADGPFDRVAVRSGGRCIRLRLTGGR